MAVPYSSERHQTASQNVEGKPSSEKIDGNAIVLLPLYSHLLCNRFEQLGCFWRRSSTTAEYGRTECSLLYLKYTSKVAALLVILVSDVCLLEASGSIGRGVRVENQYVNECPVHWMP